MRIMIESKATGVTLLREPTVEWNANPDSFTHDGPTFEWIVVRSAPCVPPIITDEEAAA